MGDGAGACLILLLKIQMLSIFVNAHSRDRLHASSELTKFCREFSVFLRRSFDGLLPILEL